MEKMIEKQAVIKFVVLFIAILCSILMAICLFRSGIVYDTWGNGKGPTPFFALKGLWMIGAVSILFGLITLSCMPYGWSRWFKIIQLSITLCLLIFTLIACTVSTTWLNQIKMDKDIKAVTPYVMYNISGKSENWSVSNTFFFLDYQRNYLRLGEISYTEKAALSSCSYKVFLRIDDGSEHLLSEATYVNADGEKKMGEELYFSYDEETSSIFKDSKNCLLTMVLNFDTQDKKQIEETIHLHGEFEFIDVFQSMT